MKNIFHDKTISILYEINNRPGISLEELWNKFTVSTKTRLEDLKKQGFIEELRFQTEPHIVYRLTAKGISWIEDFNDAKIKIKHNKRLQWFLDNIIAICAIIISIVSLLISIIK